MPSPEERHGREPQPRAQILLSLGLVYRGRTVMVWVVGAALVAFGLLVQGGAFVGAVESADQLMLHGALMPERVQHGEWWRLISGPLLHRSLSHLLANLIGLALIGHLVELTFGKSGFVCLYFGASLAGAFATIAAGHAVSVGASGAVFGLISGLLAAGIRLWRSPRWRLSPGLRWSLVGLPAIILGGLLILGGAGDGGPHPMDVAAHTGGMIGGSLLGASLPLRLRDVDDRALMHLAPPWLSRWTRLLAAALLVVALLAVAALVRRVGQPTTLAAIDVRGLSWAAATVNVPRGLRARVWRPGGSASRCVGATVDPEETIRAGRVACFELPLSGTLRLGRPEQLASMDAGDRGALARAQRERQFVWRQRNFLMAPAGGGLIYVVSGHPGLLRDYAASLAPLLRTSDRRPEPPAHGLSQRATATNAAEPWAAH